MSKLTPEGRADALRQAQRICNEMRYGLVTVAVARLAIEQEEEIARVMRERDVNRSYASRCEAEIASLRSAAQEMAEALKTEIALHHPIAPTGHCAECGRAICEAEDRLLPALAAWEKVK